jgi:voltage-gated sodium channel
MGWRPRYPRLWGTSVIERLRAVLADPRTEWVVLALILVNAAILGLETSPTVMNAVGPALTFLDAVILTIFVIEIAARMAVHRLAFFRDPWSVFDFLVVGIALVPATENLSVLRALRVLRVLRLITVVPALRRVVGGLILSLPGMGSIALLLLLVFYVFAVMATQLYGNAFPELFGNLARSAFTLFAVMTLETWVDGVVKPVMEKYPYAWLFFIPYILITTFAVLNLFIAVIVNAMQTEHEAARKEEERQFAEEQRKLGKISATEADVLAELRALRAEVKELGAAAKGKKGKSRA